MSSGPRHDDSLRASASCSPVESCTSDAGTWADISCHFFSGAVLLKISHSDKRISVSSRSASTALSLWVGCFSFSRVGVAALFFLLLCGAAFLLLLWEVMLSLPTTFGWCCLAFSFFRMVLLSPSPPNACYFPLPPWGGAVVFHETKSDNVTIV